MMEHVFSTNREAHGDGDGDGRYLKKLLNSKLFSFFQLQSP